MKAKAIHKLAQEERSIGYVVGMDAPRLRLPILGATMSQPIAPSTPLCFWVRLKRSKPRQRRATVASEHDLIWYRCECGKAFSNEVEIDPPDPYDDSSIRYYFEGGSVFYPAYGDSFARCWECAEGEHRITMGLGGLVVGNSLVSGDEMHRLARSFPAQHPDRRGGWNTLNVITDLIATAAKIPDGIRLRYWVRRWLFEHGYEVENKGLYRLRLL